MFLVGQPPGLPIARLTAFAFVHAISQTVAITWALYPKIVSNFVRPSLYSLPIASYVLCGLGSYLTGALILFVFRVYIPLPYPIILPTLLSSLSFLFMTVGMSVLIDLRLKSSSLDFEQGRVREGAVIALLMLASTLTFQAVMIYAGELQPTWLSAGFLVLSAGLGFVMDITFHLRGPRTCRRQDCTRPIGSSPAALPIRSVAATRHGSIPPMPIRPCKREIPACG